MSNNVISSQDRTPHIQCLDALLQKNKEGQRELHCVFMNIEKTFG